MAGSSYDEFMQVEPDRHIPIWPVVASLFVTGLVASGSSSLLIGMVAPLEQLGGGTSRVATLGFYVVPMVVSVLVGALLLPVILRELADVLISGAAAALVMLADVLVTFAVRYAIAEAVLDGSNRFARPTPAGFLTAGLVLTWGASLVGTVVAVQLIRGLAVSGRTGEHGYRGAAARRVSLAGLAVPLVIGLALVGVVVAKPGDRITNRGGRPPTAGLSLAVYAAELRATQDWVVDAFNTVRIGPAIAMPQLLQQDIETLEARRNLLMTMAAPNTRASTAQKKLIAGLQAFTPALFRVAVLPTTRAQQHAFRSAPGLRTTYNALVQLEAVLVRLDAPGAKIFDHAKWSRILGERHS
jgi:hypothetical protein